MSASQASPSPPAKTRRRWLQFSLRGLLLLTLVVAWPISRYAKRLEDQRRWELSRVVPTAWDIKTGYNILWSANLGSQTNGTPVVAGEKVFVGTNNGQGYVPRFPSTLDAGVLLCFDASDGRFLWQHTNLKLPTGRVHDWPLQGVCATPTVEGNRLWYVSNRCEVVCLDTEGFQDRQNDGPFTQEDTVAGDEADVVWKFDMMGALGVSPHNMSCSPVALLGDQAFVVTGNGVDESHVKLPAKRAPSFISLDKHTGRLLWSDSSPGSNILHGQWGSPVVGELGGARQVLFPGGDGWLYSFDADATRQGKTTLLWKFDCNPKASRWSLGGRGTRNNLVARPVIHNGLIYLPVGQDPEHGEGPGRLWCIDPTRRGDVSAELVFNKADPRRPIAHKRLQACDAAAGDFVRPNPNSAVVWVFEKSDLNGNGKFEYEETMHRSISRVAIENDLLFAADFSGFALCLDAKTGKLHWSHDLFAACWSSPIIAGQHVYLGDEDGDMTVFALDKKLRTDSEMFLENCIYSTPAVGQNVLYIATKNKLYAIKDLPPPAKASNQVTGK